MFKTKGRRHFFKDISGIADRLEPSRAFLAKIVDEGARISLTVNLYGDKNIGDVLSWREMQRLADLKIDLGLEVFL